MSKEEFMKKASETWDKLQETRSTTPDFFNYEKDFDELWVEYGRVTLEGTIGSKQTTDRRKKKGQLSRYGTIELHKDDEWSVNTQGFGITPYMQNLMLFTGQSDNYQAGEGQIERYLRVSADDSQINRLCQRYGDLLESDSISLNSSVEQKAKSDALKTEKGEKVYVMSDGCMLPTREEGGSWREMKLGRLFRESERFDLDKKTNIIRTSTYVSHFGSYEMFINKFEKVVDSYDFSGPDLVFINDGAPWINTWVSDNYPNATNILDFYHSAEYVYDFAKTVWKDKSKQSEWASSQKLLLLNDGIEKVIDNIIEIQVRGKIKEAAKNKILTYFGNNQHRMHYKTYTDRGLLIGSGPIESAHRFVLQKRLKQSGQLWTKKGAQAVANLRIAHLNGQWENVIQLISPIAA